MAKENPAEKPAEQPVPQARDPKIDAIRDIIFGQNIQEYNEQFNTLDAKLNNTREEIEDKINRTREELTNMINSLREDTLAQLQNLRLHTDQEVARLDEAKADRRLMGSLLVEIGEKIRKES